MLINKVLTVIVALLPIVLLGGCIVTGVGATTGNGRMVDGVFSHDGSITRIAITDMAATINISPENSREVRYTIDENLKDLLEISYQNGALQIAARNNRSINSNGIRFYIGSNALEEIVVDGAASIQGSGPFNAEMFALKINGAGEAELALNVQNVLLEINGAADITLSGATENLHVRLSGAADISARNLIAQHATVVVEGVGSVEVYAQQTLDASVDGVGTITYWGDPELTSSAAGMSSVRRGS